MILQSHNSWSYLKPKKWWMKLLRFTAKCQAYDVYDQYYLYDVKAFDLRVRFDKSGNIVIAHGLIEYDYSYDKLMKDLQFFEKIKGITVRVLHEIRKEKQNTNDELVKFIEFCAKIQKQFPNIRFYGGFNLFNGHVDYNFRIKITEESHYSSVCPPNIIDDWFPWLYARIHNKKVLKNGTSKELLAIDFVNIGQKILKV